MAGGSPESQSTNSYQQSPHQTSKSAATPSLPSPSSDLFNLKGSKDVSSNRKREETPLYPPLETPNPTDPMKGLDSQRDIGVEKDQLTPLATAPDSDQLEEEEDGADEGRLLLPKASRPPPIVHRWNIIPILLFIWFLGASGYYYYIRYTMLTKAYSIFIFAIEILGWTSFAPYAILITRGVYPTGSPGLPPDGSPEADEQAAWWSSPERNEPHTNVKKPRQAPLFEMERLGSHSIDDQRPHRSIPRSQGSNTSSAYGMDAKPRVLGYTPLPQRSGRKAILASATSLDQTLSPSIPGLPLFGSSSSSLKPDAQQLTPGLNMPYSWYRFHVRVLVPCYKEDLSVVSSTVNAALAADLPAMTTRTVYLLDDGKDEDKRQFIEDLKLNGDAVEYISGRVRPKGEVNGKSGNLNNALKNHIFNAIPKNDEGLTDWTELSNKEVIVIFDADMNCKGDFFLKTLEVMIDDDLALTLTPQAFYNADADIDIFNSINAQFWEYWLPGAFAWGYIACTGTNFMIRARALCHCGWFPLYTITEDYALGMELKSKGYRATYLCQYLAEGEAPDEARNVFQQRSRWTKGHYQVFFSRLNPIFNFRLPFFQRLWYTYAAWAPFCTSVTLPAFMLVPFLSLVFGLFPVSITYPLVLASTLYYVSLQCIQHYCTRLDHLRLMYYVQVSNTVLWFTYCKAFFNTLLGKVGFKATAFKVTKKKGGEANTGAPVLARSVAIPRHVISALMTPIRALMSPRGTRRDIDGDRDRDRDRSFHGTTRRYDHLPTLDRAKMQREGKDPNLASSPDSLSVELVPSSPTPPPPLLSMNYTPNNITSGKAHDGSLPLSYGSRGANDTLQGTQRNLQEGPGIQRILQEGSSMPASGYASSPPPHEPYKELSGWERFKAVAATFRPQNIREVGKMLDPLVLLLIWIFNIGIVALGVWQLTLTVNQLSKTGYAFNSPLSGNPYLIISTIWALFNSIPAYLFLHYCFTAGLSFKFMVKWSMHFSFLLCMASIVIVWLLIPSEFDISEVVSLATENYFPSTVAADPNNNYVFVYGLNATRIANASGIFSRATQPFSAALFGKDVSLLTTSAPLPPIDLSGGLLVTDHVKYGMPMSYSLAIMAWSYLAFPGGIKGKERDSLLRVIKSGADYLMRCYIELPDNGGAVFVAQVGDGSKYAIAGETERRRFIPNSPLLSGIDGGTGKRWTAPSLDPQLVHDSSYGAVDEERMVWLMTGQMIGADLLADVSGALAAVSMVFKEIDPSFSQRSILAAERIYIFATLDLSRTRETRVRPHSYCDYVPCTAQVAASVRVLARPYEAPLPSEPVCYYIDWVDKACYIGPDLDTCVSIAGRQREVFKTRTACCNAMTNTGFWSSLASQAQGICAVPEDQWSCFIPDTSQRTCHTLPINSTTGTGCTGHGLEIFPSAPVCCNFLQRSGAIDASSGLTGSGSCSRSSLDPTFKQCYVPVLNNATCQLLEGEACSAFGIHSMFDDVAGCCNDMIVTMQTCADNACNFLWIDQVEIVTLFNSSSVFDDLSWAATWLYKATGNSLFLGLAQNFLERHYSEEETPADMIRDASYYRVGWDNVAWYVNVLLSGLTGLDQYKSRAELMLKTWVFADSVNLDTPLPPATAAVNLSSVTALRNITIASSSYSSLNNQGGDTQTWLVVPECTPTSAFEDVCNDGIDNNCNGFTDQEDLDCGLFPVLYSPQGLAFSGSPSVPNAGGVSFLAMLYSSSGSVSTLTQSRLRCWALSQAAYIIGTVEGSSSKVLGYGEDYPGVVQHRGSSCPSSFAPILNSSFIGGMRAGGSPDCNWDNAFFPSSPNPGIASIRGALISGPSSYYPFQVADGYSTLRTFDDTKVTLHDTTPFIGAAMALVHTNTNTKSCEAGQGVYQKYALNGQL